MRKIISPEIKLKKGDTRTITRFQVFPKTLIARPSGVRIKRWLERVSILQTFTFECGQDAGSPYWADTEWIDIDDNLK